MRDNVTIYLGIDGVLHPRAVDLRAGKEPKLAMAGHSLFENNWVLENVIVEFPNTYIVLHSWWVPCYGFLPTLRKLPTRTHDHVVGATYAGNRCNRFRNKPVRPRREWLRDDLLRRRPVNPIIVDSDWMQVLPGMEDQSFIFDTIRGIAERSGEASCRLWATLARTGL